MLTLNREKDVFVLDLGDDENRWSPGWISALNTALDEVEAGDAPRALVTIATGRFWSNGLDLEWLGQHPEQLVDYLWKAQRLLARMLALPMPTVAALQGHTFAAGAMLALAHDFRVMREDRAFFCLPEVDLHIPFTPGMSALIRAKLTPQVAVQAMTTGHRYGGTAAWKTAIVDIAAPKDDGQTTALKVVQPLAAKPAPF